MASISIFNLDSQSSPSYLIDNDLEKISGGSCTYAGVKFGAGSVIYQADGYLYTCKDIRFRPDKWVRA
jgi:hypothetical protein